MLVSLEPPYFEPQSLLDEVPTTSALGFRIIVHGIHSPLQLAVVANPAQLHYWTLIGLSWIVLVIFRAFTVDSYEHEAESTPLPSPTLLLLLNVAVPIFMRLR